MKRLLNFLILVLSTVVLLGDCGGSGGGGGSSLQPAAYNDIAGAWKQADTNCQPQSCCTLNSNTFTVNTQSGNTLNATDSQGDQFTATISGNVITYSSSNAPGSNCNGQHPESVTITLTSETAGTYLSQWQCITTTATCNGTSTGTITKTSGSGLLTVTYNGNGSTSGSVPVDSNKYDIGQAVTVLGNGNLVKTGDTFTGWNTQANGTGTTYTAGQTFTMGSTNVTLYALWTVQPTYTVTYSGNGLTTCTVPTDGTHYLTSQTVTVKGYTCNLVKDGYLFTDWNTASSGSGTAYTVGQNFSMGSANVTLYAIFSPIKLVFVTSETFTWSSSPPVGAAGGDAGCLSFAQNAGLTGNWLAWLSDATTSPSIRFTQNTIPYVTLDGTVIANNWTQLTSGTLQNAIMHDQNGAAVAASYVWTGTNANGTAVTSISTNDCNNWTAGTSGYSGTVGYLQYPNSEWTNDTSYSCLNTARLYCFQQ
jgi:uncharacterized repeat protein (TIGR02543 family)